MARRIMEAGYPTALWAWRRAPWNLAPIPRPEPPIPPPVRSSSSWRGDLDAVERAPRPVSAGYADPILHVGAPGAGQCVELVNVELVNNALFAAQIGLVAEAVRPAGHFGLDEATVLSVLPHAGSSGWAVAGGSVAAFSDAVGEFLRKDIAVARRPIDELGTDLGSLDPPSAPPSTKPAPEYHAPPPGPYHPAESTPARPDPDATAGASGQLGERPSIRSSR
ncbi:NAD(P)-dependent oxidoreductase [Nocardia paucivorans]|uniref:NAD(P)-dependent oxidoreductase n=1 Tax=Nocardia paucivorans TaxID=114259 RepID=UPI000593482C|nr:NAD(P)-dependent oxidoreductase [Nocardia paucivorans]